MNRYVWDGGWGCVSEWKKGPWIRETEAEAEAEVDGIGERGREKERRADHPRLIEREE